MKKKVLFLIHDLGPGGAEKVLVNLVNELDRNLFDVSLRTLFDWGPNREALKENVHYSSWISRNVPCNSHWMKLWTPEQLYKKIIPEQYDCVVSFLEGPCARVVGGCPKRDKNTKIIDWIHTPIKSEGKYAEGFRSKTEADCCYSRADEIVFVSNDVRNAFKAFYSPLIHEKILYNVYDSDIIRERAVGPAIGIDIDDSLQNWCGIGKLIPLKGWKRLLMIQKKLMDEKIPAHFYVIGDGPQRNELEQYVRDLEIEDSVTFTGYQTNPYAVLSRCDLFVCASEREGFSTAAVEALLTGTPVCTVDVGGMREILGENNEFGIVTENDENSLYLAVRGLLTDPEKLQYYRKQAVIRSQLFSKENSVRAVEELLFA